MTEKEIKRFYKSAEWQRKRQEIINRDFHECQDCRERLRNAAKEGKVLIGRDRVIRRGEEVHHIKPLRDFPSLKLDDDNLISLCTECHNIRHGRIPQNFSRKKKVVSEEKW